MTTEEPYVPVDEVAEKFSVSIPTIRVWVRTKRIPPGAYIKIGNTYRFKLSAVVAALVGATDNDGVVDTYDTPDHLEIPEIDDEGFQDEDDLQALFDNDDDL